MNHFARFFLVNFVVLGAFVMLPAFAQMPNTDIFLADITLNGAKIKVGVPENITARAGYDNQPRFTPDGNSILFTTTRDNVQTDIYRYSLREKLSARVTTTTESEFSPAITPDGKFLTVVRIDKNPRNPNDSTQHLWRFTLQGITPQVLIPHVRPVGYYAWLNAENVILFLLGSKGKAPSLHLANIPNRTSEELAVDIKRSLHAIPAKAKLPAQASKTKSTIAMGSFIQNIDSKWIICSLNPTTKEITPLVEALEGSEDFAWTPQGSLLMAKGTKLYHRQLTDKEWREVTDFSNVASIKSLSRLALSPDGKRIAFVAEVQ